MSEQEILQIRDTLRSHQLVMENIGGEWRNQLGHLTTSIHVIVAVEPGLNLHGTDCPGT